MIETFFALFQEMSRQEFERKFYIQTLQTKVDIAQVADRVKKQCEGCIQVVDDAEIDTEMQARYRRFLKDVRLEETCAAFLGCYPKVVYPTDEHGNPAPGKADFRFVVPKSLATDARLKQIRDAWDGVYRRLKLPRHERWLTFGSAARSGVVQDSLCFGPMVFPKAKPWHLSPEEWADANAGSFKTELYIGAKLTVALMFQPLDGMSGELLTKRTVYKQNSGLRQHNEDCFRDGGKLLEEPHFQNNTAVATLDSARVTAAHKRRLRSSAVNALRTGFCSLDFRVTSGNRARLDTWQEEYRAGTEQDKAADFVLDDAAAAAAAGEPNQKAKAKVSVRRKVTKIRTITARLNVIKRFLNEERTWKVGDTPSDFCIAAWRKQMLKDAGFEEGTLDLERLIPVWDFLCVAVSVSPRHQADVECAISQLKQKQQELRSAFRGILRIDAKHIKQMLSVEREKAKNFAGYGTRTAAPPKQEKAKKTDAPTRHSWWHECQRATGKRPGESKEDGDHDDEHAYRAAAKEHNVRNQEKAVTFRQNQAAKELQAKQTLSQRYSKAATQLEYYNVLERRARERYGANVGRSGAARRTNAKLSETEIVLSLPAPSTGSSFASSSAAVLYSRTAMLNYMRDLLEAKIVPSADYKLLEVVRLYAQPSCGLERVVAWLAGARKDQLEWEDLQEYLDDYSERKEEDDEAELEALEHAHPAVQVFFEQHPRAHIVLDLRNVRDQIQPPEDHERALTKKLVGPQTLPEGDCVAVLWCDRQPFSFCGQMGKFLSRTGPEVVEVEIVIDMEDDLLAGDGFQSPRQIEIAPGPQFGPQECVVQLPEQFRYRDNFSSAFWREALRSLDGKQIPLHAAEINEFAPNELRVIWSSTAMVPSSGSNRSKTVGGAYAAAPAAVPKPERKLGDELPFQRQFREQVEAEEKRMRQAGGNFYQVHQLRPGGAIAATSSSAAAGNSATASSRAGAHAAASILGSGKMAEADSSGNISRLYDPLSEAEKKRRLMMHRAQHEKQELVRAARSIESVPGFEIKILSIKQVSAEPVEKQYKEMLPKLMAAIAMPEELGCQSKVGMRTFAWDPTDESEGGDTLGAAKKMAYLWAQRTKVILDCVLGRDKLFLYRAFGDSESFQDSKTFTLEQRRDYMQNEIMDFVAAVEGNDALGIPGLDGLPTRWKNVFEEKLKNISTVLVRRLIHTNWSQAVSHGQFKPKKRRTTTAASDGEQNMKK
eukprot:g10461.t1